MIEHRAPQDIAQQQIEKDRLQMYRNVFGTPEGKLVLGDILVSCHFGVPINNDAERIEYNVGVSIARMSGAMEQVDRILGIATGK